MPDVKRIWLKAALGIEIPDGGDAEAADEPARRLAKGGRGDAAGTASAPTAAAGASSASPLPRPSSPAPAAPPPRGKGPAPADPDIDTPIKALGEEAAALKKLGFDTKQMVADGAELSRSGIATKKLADDTARQKALAQIKKRAEEELEHAQALSKSIKAIMGDKKGNPDATQKSAIYKNALEDLYGLKITVPSGMANTHLDRVFDMFGTVPKGDVKQDKLKKLTYSTAEKDKGGGAYGSTEIEMGDFGDATSKENYQIDGKVIPANSFDVTTLHEIGHSVDEKNTIMNNNQSKAGCGGWKSEKVATVAAAFLGELKKSVKLKDKLADAVLIDVLTNALDGGTTDQPDTIKNFDDWKKILDFLVDKCLKIRTDADPWFAPKQIVVGDRVYQESYDGEWWSYDFKARAATKVNNYQWRSPAEWFAEVYAISWLSKKKPPSGVDAAIVAYMWKG
jgi:hypothetical protein